MFTWTYWPPCRVRVRCCEQHPGAGPVKNSDCLRPTCDSPGGYQDRGGRAGRGHADQPVRGAVVGQGEEHARRGAARQLEAGRRPEHEHVVDPERVVHDRRRPGRRLVPLLGGRVGAGLTASDGGDQPRGGHHHEAAQRQKAAPAADHCVLSSGSNEHVCIAAQRIGSGPRRSQQPLADSAGRCCRLPAGEPLAGAAWRWRWLRPASAAGRPCRARRAARGQRAHVVLDLESVPGPGSPGRAEPSRRTTTAVSAVTW